MPDVDLQVSPIFPDGHTVELFPNFAGTSWPGVPPSSPIDSATVTNARVTFANVSEGSYFIAAQVSAVWRYIAVAIYSPAPTTEFLVHGEPIGGSSDLTGSLPDDIQLPATVERTTNKSQPSGYASLGPDGKVPSAELSLPSSDAYKGAWDADTNTPTLADGVGANGDFYAVSVAGTVDLGSGNIIFAVGNTVIYNGTIWEKIGSAGAVTTVAGRDGDVVLTKADVGLTNVDNTADIAKPISTSTQNALNLKQTLDTDLTALAALVSAADKLPYATGSGTWSLADFTAFARTLLDDADAAAMRTTLGAQASDATLTALAGLSTVADRIIYSTGVDTFALATLSTFVRGTLGAADASAFRTAISAVGTPLAQSDVTNLVADLAAINAALTALTKVSTGADRTLVLGDAGKVIDVGSTGARIVTIPLEASVAYPLGTVIDICRTNTGTVTITGATGGMIENPVTQTTVDSVTIAVRYGTVGLRKRNAPNTWIAGGAIG